MPEGPEVKIASDYFNVFFSNSKWMKFEIISEYYHKKYFNTFKIINQNLIIPKSTYTVGKNIFLNLEDNLIANLHLGMTGGWSNTAQKHCHFRVFSANKELFYKDVRKFGKIKIISLSEFENKFNIFFDLLHNSYNIEKHLLFLDKKINDKKSICSILMNQLYFPGVGNYIKSESLYETKLHPEEKWKKLNQTTKINLIKNTQNIMKRSYKHGGAELKDFKNPFSKSIFELKVYGKKTTPSNTPIINQLTSDSRKTWFCSKTQKLNMNN